MNSAAESREDVLAYLPRTDVTEHRRREQIYEIGSQAHSLYLVIEGRVMVARDLQSGRRIGLSIHGPEDLFGLGGMVNSEREESAVALGDTKLMSWPLATIRQLMAKEPRLAHALLEYSISESERHKNRIESLASEQTLGRLIRALLEIPELDDGSRVFPGSQVLADYIGTRREVVSQHLVNLRRDGMLEYTRKTVTLHPQIETVTQN